MPITIWFEIDIAPSEVAVQLDPRLPSARLKSSAPGVDVTLAQEIVTLVTSAEPIVPDPLVIVQFWLAGADSTVTR